MLAQRLAASEWYVLRGEGSFIAPQLANKLPWKVYAKAINGNPLNNDQLRLASGTSSRVKGSVTRNVRLRSDFGVIFK
jgi:hypothetical protein